MIATRLGGRWVRNSDSALSALVRDGEERPPLGESGGLAVSVLLGRSGTRGGSAAATQQLSSRALRRRRPTLKERGGLARRDSSSETPGASREDPAGSGLQRVALRLGGDGFAITGEARDEARRVERSTTSPEREHETRDEFGARVVSQEISSSRGSEASSGVFSGRCSRV